MPGAIINLALAFLAGALTILSPCVLPLVPVVLGSAAQEHRYGPLALAGGLIASFTIVGFVVAAFGSSIGLDENQLRLTGAIMLSAAGAFLLLPRLQDRLATSAGPIISWAGERQSSLGGKGFGGQVAIGVLLGVVWSPCVGPTLGAAIALAAQGEHLGQVALTMAAFACGIALVLVAVALVGRSLFMKFKGSASAKAKSGKMLLGAILLIVGLMIITGLDRTIESLFVAAAPDWLVSLTTAI